MELNRKDRAVELHKKGYNCAQAVACNYCDLFGMDEETTAPRIAKNQIKALNKMEIKAGYCDGKVIDANAVNTLASIPSKEQLIANLLSMLNAPVSALARTLQAIADKQIKV